MARNAIYWYFPSRDELFVVVMRRPLEAIGARKPRGERDVARRILWWTDQFAPLYAYRALMQEQARESEIIARFVKELDELLHRMLGNAFRGRVRDDQMEAAIASFRATVAGTYAQDLPVRRRHEVLKFSFDRLLQEP